jgi:signal transduction protein with GAF and PtsI domain
MQTERVTYLTNAEQKAALEAFAKARGESVGNVLREATARYMAQPMADDEEEALRLLADELNEAVPKIRASLERSAHNIEKSIEEVDRKLRAAGIRK